MAALLVSSSVFAEMPNEEEMFLLNGIRNMREKQQAEEHVVRIRQYQATAPKKECTLVQQIRQRMKDIEAGEDEETTQNVNITAGHGSMNVTDNHGEINSDINVQIIQNGETQECL